jgi:hypothetical protein
LKHLLVPVIQVWRAMDDLAAAEVARALSARHG